MGIFRYLFILMECWSIGVLECWIFRLFMSIYRIAFLDYQMVNPISSITLPFQALHEFKKPIFQFIGLGIESFKLFLRYLFCFSIAVKPRY